MNGPDLNFSCQISKWILNIRKHVSNQVSIEKWDNFFSNSMAVFVLLERISPGLTNQNTFNGVHAMNYEIIVLLCCWLEVIKWMQQSIPAKVLPIKSCGGFFLGDRILDLGSLYLLRFTKRSLLKQQKQSFFLKLI